MVSTGREMPETLNDPPPPRIQGIQTDQQGRILVLSLVGGDSWREAVRDGGVHRLVTNWQDYYDSIIELLDPYTGEVLGSVKSPRAFNAFVDDGLLSAVIFDDVNVPFVEVWRVQFQE